MQLHTHVCITHIICTHAQASPRNLSGDDRNRAFKPTVKLLAVNQRMYPCRISRTYQHPSVSHSLSLSLSPSRTPPSLSRSLYLGLPIIRSLSRSLTYSTIIAYPAIALTLDLSGYIYSKCRPLMRTQGTAVSRHATARGSHVLRVHVLTGMWKLDMTYSAIRGAGYIHIITCQ